MNLDRRPLGQEHPLPLFIGDQFEGVVFAKRANSSSNRIK